MTDHFGFGLRANTLNATNGSAHYGPRKTHLLNTRRSDPTNRKAHSLAVGLPVKT